MLVNVLDGDSLRRVYNHAVWLGLVMVFASLSQPSMTSVVGKSWNLVAPCAVTLRVKDRVFGSGIAELYTRVFSTTLM